MPRRAPLCCALSAPLARAARYCVLLLQLLVLDLVSIGIVDPIWRGLSLSFVVFVMSMLQLFFLPFVSVWNNRLQVRGHGGGHRDARR